MDWIFKVKCSPLVTCQFCEQLKLENMIDHRGYSQGSKRAYAPFVLEQILTKQAIEFSSIVDSAVAF